MTKVKEAENYDSTGDYIQATRSAADLIGLIDRIDSGAVTKSSIGSIRDSARELGKTVANLPLPFGSDNEKVRYSDLPPALQSLIKDMMARVEKKIGSKDAAEASVKLASFKSGGDYFTQSEISAELSKMLRLLT